MKYLKNVIVLLLAITVSGCSTFSRSPRRDFPDHIRDECYGALNYAEQVIKDVGVHSIEPKNVRVELVPGERQFSGQWAFLYTGPGYPDGIWVLGICLNRGRLIKLAVDPNNPHNIEIGVLQHEFAHHWLIANGHTDMHHYPIYDRYFEGWARGRRVTGLRTGPRVKHISVETEDDYIVIHAIEE